jgi:hypothetical protein
MWWVTTFSGLTAGAVLLVATAAAWLGWNGRESAILRAVPFALKIGSVVAVMGIVIVEVLAIVNALNGRESVTVRFAPTWPTLGYTVGDSNQAVIRLEYGEFSLAQLTTSHLIGIAQLWSVVQHVSLIALVLVILFVVWRIARSLEAGTFRGSLTSATLLRSGLAVMGIGVLWQGAAQTLQIIIGRMTPIRWEMAPMWPREFWTIFGNITWPFTDIELWPLILGFVLVIAATALKKTERDEAELEGLI